MSRLQPDNQTCFAAQAGPGRGLSAAAVTVPEHLWGERWGRPLVLPSVSGTPRPIAVLTRALLPVQPGLLAPAARVRDKGSVTLLCPKQQGTAEGRRVLPVSSREAEPEQGLCKHLSVPRVCGRGFPYRSQLAVYGTSSLSF